jgi:starch synthase
MPKILFLSSEMVPYCKTGGLADVSGSLPATLSAMGHDVRSVLPFYEFIKQPMREFSPFHIHVSGYAREGMILQSADNPQHFFVAHYHYFGRQGIYGDAYGEFGDNDERYAYFCEAALLLCKISGWKPDIIHINDWQTGIMGPLLRVKYGNDPFFHGTKIVFTIHNLQYQGEFDRGIYHKFALPESVMRFDGMEFHGHASYMKAGLQYSDVISTVSPNYAREIQTTEYGFGLDGVVRANNFKLTGVLNGIDTEVWNPETDSYFQGLNYSAGNMSNKQVLKQRFLEECSLPYWEHVPLIGMVSRFTSQKGLGLVEAAAERILQMGTQMVFLGTGEPGFVQSLNYFQEKYPRQVRAFITYDDRLSHLIQGASDYFLMPSRFEPCGLTQMYALRYGTMPIVYNTGGLADTVFDCDRNPENGNGYVFYEYTREALIDAVRRALGLYKDPGIRYIVQQRGMAEDFSWQRSASTYTQIYNYLLSH